MKNGPKSASTHGRGRTLARYLSVSDRIPATGPVVIVANHQHLLDGAVLFGCLPRRVAFLIKAEAVQGALGWLLTAVGHYAIVRGTPDRKPLLQALNQLKAGGVIGIFPEGTRGAGNVDSVFAGAGWLAARAGAPVVPVAIRGTVRPAGSRRRFRPVVTVLVGQPFAVPTGGGRKPVAEATEAIRVNLTALVRELDADLARNDGARTA